MSGFYHVILPAAGTNGVANPSAEVNATGWAGTAGGVATRQAGTAAFGAWAIAGTVGAAQGTGVTYGTLTQLAGSYTVSAYVYGGSGSVYSIGIKGTGAGAAFVGSVAGTTGGTWHRYSFSYGESGANNRLFAVVKRSAGADPFIVDGVQVEGGTFQTTYIDGNQEGCRWTGAAHASSSSRSGTSRAGGTVVSLQSLGLTVLEHGGVGMPPVANITQEYALADGALWQRQRATARVFTLTGLLSGTSWAGLHARRAGIIDALKIDRTPNPQPVRLLYTGAGGTAQIDAYYDGGMGFDSRNGFAETLAVRLLAPDPYWSATQDAGTALAQSVALGSANYIMYRDPVGRWGTMGQTLGTGGLGALAVARTMTAGPAGTIVVAGDFVSAGGTTARGIAQWANGAWGTLGPGTLSNGAQNTDIYALYFSQTGTLFVGGNFATVAGTACSFVAQWTSAGWGTPTGGTPSGRPEAIAQLPDTTLLFGGAFTTVAGTTSGAVARYTGAGWGTLTGGTARNSVSGFVVLGENDVIVSGVSTAAGTIVGGIARHNNGTWGSLTGGGVGGDITAVAAAPNGALYAVGQFTSAGAGSAQNVAQWNGNQWAAMGAGLGGAIYDLVVGTNQTYAIGITTNSGSVTLPRGVARWNGANWLPLDATFPTGTTVSGIFAYTGALSQDGTFFVGGGFYGTASAAAVATIVNGGAANAYPVLVVRNTGAGTARLVQLLNTLTGDAIYFNLAALPGETLTLDLRTGSKTLTSDTRGNLLGAVLPGSSLTTWRLAPGTNTVSFFANSGTVEATLYWRPRAWSNDSRFV